MSVRKRLVPVLCLAVVAGAAWLANRSSGEKEKAGWTEVTPGVLRSPGSPAGYALVSGNRALLIDAPRPADDLKAQGVKKIDGVLLTHHHRDSCAAAEKLLSQGVPVRAPRTSAPWLTPDGVRKYWQESLPLRNSRTAYLVLPEGLRGVDCSLTDDQVIEWEGWSLRVVATPGHTQ